MKEQLGNYKDADGRIGHKSKKWGRKGMMEERERKKTLMSHSTELVK